MMLRSDEQVALEDLHRALRRTGAGHRDAAQTLDPGDLATFLEELATERDAMAAEVATIIRATGDLPDEPDADRETLRTAARHLKAALSRDDRRPLLLDRDRAEADLAATLTGARHTLGSGHEPVLDRYLERVAAARARLAAA